MKRSIFNHRGTTMNKVAFSEIESYLEEKGINVDAAFLELADDSEHVFVSDGFIRGLMSENEAGEWHHYFKKDKDGDFRAFKFKFN